MKRLQIQVTAKEANERFATSKVRMDAQQAKLQQYERCLNGQNERIAELEKKLTASKTGVKSTKEAATGLLLVAADHSDGLATNAQLKADLATVNEDISVLFDERDALANLLSEANQRIDKLEDLVSTCHIQSRKYAANTASQQVRAITRQNSNCGSNSSSNHGSPQLIPTQTSNGQALDLSVPKGRPLVPLKVEKQAPIRTFTPGKQWMT